MDKFVIVNGGTQKQRWLVEDISWWFCDKYFNRFKSWNIEIDLEKIEGKVQGWCMHIDGNACHVTIDKRLKGDDFITCVLHELVHVKQHLKKELKDVNHGCFSMWKGSVIHLDDTNYYDLPWEKEAYELQEVLLNEYKKSMG